MSFKINSWEFRYDTICGVIVVSTVMIICALFVTNSFTHQIRSNGSQSRKILEAILEKSSSRNDDELRLMNRIRELEVKQEIISSEESNNTAKMREILKSLKKSNKK